LTPEIGPDAELLPFAPRENGRMAVKFVDMGG
jgi:hypothetical protein